MIDRRVVRVCTCTDKMYFMSVLSRLRKPMTIQASPRVSPCVFACARRLTPTTFTVRRVKLGIVRTGLSKHQSKVHECSSEHYFRVWFDIRTVLLPCLVCYIVQCNVEDQSSAHEFSLVNEGRA